MLCITTRYKDFDFYSKMESHCRALRRQVLMICPYFILATVLRMELRKARVKARRPIKRTLQ